MDILYRIISRFHQSLLLLLYLILSMLMMLSSDSLLVEGVRTASLETFGVVQEAYDTMTAYFYLRSQNRELMKQNTELALENAQLQDAVLENIRLRKLLSCQFDLDLPHLDSADTRVRNGFRKQQNPVGRFREEEIPHADGHAERLPVHPDQKDRSLERRSQASPC